MTNEKEMCAAFFIYILRVRFPGVLSPVPPLKFRQ
jgi:hypothetical protein